MIPRRAVFRGAAFALLSLLFAGGTGCSRKPTPKQIEAWNAELAGLQTEQDSLRARAAELVAVDPRIRSLPEGDVVIAVPTAFVRSVIHRLFADVVSHVTLSIGGIKAHAEKKIKKIVPIGEFKVDVDIDKVVGKLRPGDPRIGFGGDSVSMSLPVTLAEGKGEATIHFVWDGKNVAGLTCGDLDITQKVTGDVIPDHYVVAGSVGLVVKGRQVVAALRFPETRWRIRVKASKESWDAIHKILDEKKGVCGWVLEKVDVPNLLKNLSEEKGFNVRLPIDKIKPAVIPAGISDSVSVGDRTFAVAAQMSGLRIDPDALWFSARVNLEGVPRAPLPAKAAGVGSRDDQNVQPKLVTTP